jgi:hypothetical protein
LLIFLPPLTSYAIISRSARFVKRNVKIRATGPDHSL